MININLVGYLAASIGTVLMIPQLIKSIKTKQVKDLSVLMLLFYLLNCILWAEYGILINSFPIIICNFIALIISGFLFIIKIKYN